MRTLGGLREDLPDAGSMLSGAGEYFDESNGIKGVEESAEEGGSKGGCVGWSGMALLMPLAASTTTGLLI